MAINAQDFLNALDEIEVVKGISRDQILVALKEAMAKGFRKQLGGDDANVIVNIDPENGVLEMFHVKDIVDEVEDDFLQVSKEDAKQLQKEHVGVIVENTFQIPASVEDLRKATALSIKSILKQKFAEAEKDILLEAFKDKIGTMITGKVEKFDAHGASVNIGRTSVFLPRNQLIGDEVYRNGDPIRIFVNNVEAGPKGAHIVVTRSNDGFLKTLFLEEIREIYDGTIEIKAIAREAGERSKVSVFTANPDIDPAGACIGQNGARIQKIVAQLGNGNAKEKIDIIAFSTNPGLYIMEALKPARVLGVVVDEETRKAIAVVEDDQFSLAIGRRGVNVKLASRLTNYAIDIKTKTDALDEQLSFASFEELNAIELENKAHAAEEAKRLAAEKAAAKISAETVLPGIPSGYVAPQDRVYNDEQNDLDETLAAQVEDEEISSTPVSELKKELEKEKAEVSDTPVVTKTVKTTTTLSDLESKLEEASAKANAKSTKKSFSKKKKEEETEEETKTVAVDTSTRMSIYTDEELAEFEKEDAEEDYDDSDEDIDYDDYDDYYDDDNK